MICRAGIVVFTDGLDTASLDVAEARERLFGLQERELLTTRVVGIAGSDVTDDRRSDFTAALCELSSSRGACADEEYYSELKGIDDLKDTFTDIADRLVQVTKLNDLVLRIPLGPTNCALDVRFEPQRGQSGRK